MKIRAIEKLTLGLSLYSMRAQFDKELYAAGKKVHNIQQGCAGWEELFAAKKRGINPQHVGGLTRRSVRQGQRCISYRKQARVGKNSVLPRKKVD
jgi:hypothetical protein